MQYFGMEGYPRSIVKPRGRFATEEVLSLLSVGVQAILTTAAAGADIVGTAPTPDEFSVELSDELPDVTF